MVHAMKQRSCEQSGRGRPGTWWGLVQIVREKLYERMRKEVPYVVQFEHNTCRLARDGAVLIKMNVVVPDRHVCMQATPLLLLV